MLKPVLGSQLQLGHPLARGLVGCWLMNEGGGQKVFDVSGNGNTGTLNGTIWSSGKFGASLEGDGDASRVDITEINIASGQPWSVVFWANQDSGAGTDGMIISKYGTTLNFIWLYEGNYLRVRCGNQNSDFADFTDFTGWHQYCIFTDGTTIYYYRDGVFVNSATPSDRRLLLDSLAGGYDGDTLDLDGKLDHLMVYNRAFTASEIAQLYINPFTMFEQEPIELWIGATSVEIGVPGIMTLNTGYWGPTF